jgi:hypothetical protein
MNHIMKQLTRLTLVMSFLQLGLVAFLPLGASAGDGKNTAAKSTIKAELTIPNAYRTDFSRVTAKMRSAFKTPVSISRLLPELFLRPGAFTPMRLFPLIRFNDLQIQVHFS